MKKKLLILLCLSVLLTGGCARALMTQNTEPHMVDGRLQMGDTLMVDMPEGLEIHDNVESLAADGLYYTTWTDGEPVPYENSDGNTVDLFDAEIYLLLSECKKTSTADGNVETWINTAREHYDISKEETVTCAGVDYTMVTYTCEGEDNPYERGVSAFGRVGLDAICAEFTCVKGYDKDLREILLGFLEGIEYIGEEA